MRRRVIEKVIFFVVAFPFLLPLVMLPVLLCAALLDVTVGAIWS
jgi:hypothetical protein